jgi:hypothetical protein
MLGLIEWSGLTVSARPSVVPLERRLLAMTVGNPMNCAVSFILMPPPFFDNDLRLLQREDNFTV